MRWGRAIGIRSALAAAAAAASIAGCGGSSSSGEASKSPATIVKDAAAALGHARSVQLGGVVPIGRRSTRVAIALETPTQVRIRFDQAPLLGQLVLAGGQAYVKGNAAFFLRFGGGMPANLANAIAGRWFTLPPSAGNLASVLRMFSIPTLSRCLPANHGTLRHAGTATVDGQQAIVIVDTGDRPGSRAGKLYVAATGTPFPLRFAATGTRRPGGTVPPGCTASGGQGNGVLTFSRYNEPLGVTAPAGAVNLQALLG